MLAVFLVVLVVVLFFIIVAAALCCCRLNRSRLYDNLLSGTTADRCAGRAANGRAENGAILSAHAVPHRSARSAADCPPDHRTAIDSVGIDTCGKKQGGC